ncbi:MAG: ComF family protein [Candidatus Nealsonbacteria bacterium]|nr:ComF family protein [Candidatus Nealsonbacteria bacterium]
MWINPIFDILFPKFCVNCQKEGSYLCEDCFSLIDISEKQYHLLKSINCLYCPSSYDNFIVKKLINQFKYQFIKDLAKPLSFLIITYLINLDKVKILKDFVLVPIPLHKKKLKIRGFNQAEEISKELSKFLEIPVFNNILTKIKQTPAQVELKKEERKKNIRGTFFCQEPEIIQGRKILLVDDVFTTGATLEEAAGVLRRAGAREIQAAIIAHG